MLVRLLLFAQQPVTFLVKPLNLINPLALGQCNQCRHIGPCTLESPWTSALSRATELLPSANVILQTISALGPHIPRGALE